MDTIYDNDMDTSYCLVDIEEMSDQPDDRILLVSLFLSTSLSPYYLRYVSFCRQAACASTVSLLSTKGYSRSHASPSRKITDIIVISGTAYPVYSQGKATIQRALDWVSRRWPDLVCSEKPESQTETGIVFQPTVHSIAFADAIAARASNTTWSSSASSSVSSLSSRNSSVSELSLCYTVYNTSVDDNESEAATESVASSDPDGADEHMSMGIILDPSSGII